MTVEESRARGLLEAQAKAVMLFEGITERGLIEPGRRESEVSDAIRDLAGSLIGVHRYWHKRIVRAGVNTLQALPGEPAGRGRGLGVRQRALRAPGR